MLKITTKHIATYVITFTILIMGVVFMLPDRVTKTDNQSTRLQVVATFYPLYSVASEVGGNLVDVVNLTPSGVEPHDYEPPLRDLALIRNSDVFIYNGASLEPWVKKWRELSSSQQENIVDMSDALTKSGTNLIIRDSIVDPHFWLDPIVMKSETLIIRDLFTKIDPGHKDIFAMNAERYIERLDLLDQDFDSGLSLCGLRNIVVSHKAFGYIARQYNISVTSIAGFTPDEEPSPKELTSIILLAREKGVKHIFFETVASPKLSELIAREIGGQTSVLNPLESLTPDEVQSGEDYFSIMEKNLDNLKIAMICP